MTPGDRDLIGDLVGDLLNDPGVHLDPDPEAADVIRDVLRKAAHHAATTMDPAPARARNALALDLLTADPDTAATALVVLVRVCHAESVHMWQLTGQLEETELQLTRPTSLAN